MERYLEEEKKDLENVNNELSKKVEAFIKKPGSIKEGKALLERCNAFKKRFDAFMEKIHAKAIEEAIAEERRRAIEALESRRGKPSGNARHSKGSVC